MSKTQIEDASDVDDFDVDISELPQPAPAPSRSFNPIPSMSMPRSIPGVDPEAVKTWTVLYPIYLDGKRPKKTGQRRVNKAHAVQWPLATEMAQAAASLGFKVAVEMNKRHPADWENPGRVRVLLKNSKGKPVSARIQNRSALLKRIGELHPKTPSTADISLRLPPNSPAISHGILQNAIDDPSSIVPPGMEGLAAAKPPVKPTAAIEAEKEKPESKTSKKKKDKPKVKVIRR